MLHLFRYEMASLFVKQFQHLELDEWVMDSHIYRRYSDPHQCASELGFFLLSDIETWINFRLGHRLNDFNHVLCCHYKNIIGLICCMGSDIKDIFDLQKPLQNRAGPKALHMPIHCHTLAIDDRMVWWSYGHKHLWIKVNLSHLFRTRYGQRRGIFFRIRGNPKSN